MIWRGFDDVHALVTGASAALGRELASLFARDGHDLVLVARNELRLRTLAEDLVVAADLANSEAPARIAEQVAQKGTKVDILVNNAGFGTNAAFLDLDLAREKEIITVNCSALVDLTHRFVGPMRQRGEGRVLNIASTAGFQPGPFMATYHDLEGIRDLVVPVPPRPNSPRRRATTSPVSSSEAASRAPRNWLATLTARR